MSSDSVHESPELSGPRVLVGVDGSEDGLRAVRYGARAARLGRATLHLVHAVDDAVMAGAWGVVYDPSALQEAGEHANQAARAAALEAGLDAQQVHDEVVLGNAAAVLARLSEGADLLVTGRRSVSGLERMFIGSTSVALADAAQCPLVVISAAATPGATGGQNHIAVGIDAESHSPNTLGWALAEAGARGARLTVAHVSRQEGRAGEVDEVARRAIDELLEPLRVSHPLVDVQVQVSHGNPVDELVDLSGQVDLLVLGVQRPKLLGIHLGGVMRAVLAHAQSPVALVK